MSTIGIRSTLLVALMVLGVGQTACSADKKPPATAAGATSSASSQAAGLRIEAQKQRAGDSVVIANDLKTLCGIDDTTRAPRFDYDSSVLREEGREPLQKLAECLKTGPLRGRKIQLIGRTDPRGTEDYNQRLGMARAQSVTAYLKKLGVAADALRPASRGKSDARGEDENSWALDRRVDVTLYDT